MAQPLPHNQENEDLTSWLQLARCENVGPVTFHQLLERYGTPEEALRALPELAVQGGLKRSLRLVSRAEIEKELASLAQFGAQLITFNSPFYPPLLRHIDSAPPLLAVKGNLSLLQEPTFAIVGARNASAMGKKMAHSFAEKLGKEGWAIVSGLARGIDGAATREALKAALLPSLREALIKSILRKTKLSIIRSQKKVLWWPNPPLGFNHNPPCSQGATASFPACPALC